MGCLPKTDEATLMGIFCEPPEVPGNPCKPGRGLRRCWGRVPSGLRGSCRPTQVSNVLTYAAERLRIYGPVALQRLLPRPAAVSVSAMRPHGLEAPRCIAWTVDVHVPWLGPAKAVEFFKSRAECSSPRCILDARA